MRIWHVAVAAATFAFVAGPLSAAGGAGETTTMGPEQLRGIVVAVQGNVLTLRLRNGQNENVDIGPAQTAHHTGVLPKGGAVVVYGSRDSAGVFHAASIGHTSPNQKDWAPDT